MKALKVVHIIEALGGGIYSYFVELTHSFGDLENVETTIIFSDKRKEIDPKQIYEDFNKNIKLIKIPMKRELSASADYKAFLKIKKVLEEIKPDVIHLHSSKAGVLGRAAYYFSGSDAQLYYTPHGYSFLRKDISVIKKFFFFCIEKLTQKFFGGKTIACGDTELTYSERIGPVTLVRNSVNLSKIRTVKTENEQKPLTIGILGRITYARNPELFNVLALRHPEINFMWIGDGELLDKLTAPNITITGWYTDQKKALRKLNSIDIYLQTSSWEGLPIALLEAMALEKPILATNIIGNKDIVKHGETGYLFNTIYEFDNYLFYLQDERTREIFGKNSLARCEELFDSRKNFKQLIDLYWEEYINNDVQTNLSKVH